jgi:hypothetical protein
MAIRIRITFIEPPRAPLYGRTYEVEHKGQQDVWRWRPEDGLYTALIPENGANRDENARKPREESRRTKG